MTDPGKPRLRRGVRLTFDKTRAADVVLFPEGVLVLNPTAKAVLGLCDGRSTVDQIVATLGERYAGVQEQDVTAVLERLKVRGVVEWT